MGKQTYVNPVTNPEECDVYLLHFETPISPNHTTQHYLGSADDVIARIKKHRDNPDARLLQVAKERGIKFVVARVWTGVPRKFERTLKNRKNAPKMCPICKVIHEEDHLADIETASALPLEF